MTCMVGDQAGLQATTRIENLTRSNEHRMENLQTRGARNTIRPPSSILWAGSART